MGKNAPFCMHYWRKWTFLRIHRIVRVRFLGKIFWKIWLKIMHLETLWPNYIPILILMIKTCSKLWTILDTLGPWEHPWLRSTSSHLELPWTPNKPIRWAENMTSWIPHGWMREFNATFAWVRPNRQARTTVMRWMALVARIKLPSNMAAPEIEPWSRS